MQYSNNTAPIRILVLEGDGIGPEIVNSSLQILNELNRTYQLNLHFEKMDIGFSSLKKEGTTFPEAVYQRALEVDGIILGPVSHNVYPPVEKGGLNPSGELRKRLDLYANIRPAKTVKGIPPPCQKPIDVVVVRENTEGFYADRSMHMGPGEFMPTEDIALSIRKVSRKASLRIAKKAFQLAMKREKKITIVHKGNVLRVTDGLFLQCTREMAKAYPEVHYEEKLIDAMAALLVRDSSAFDVILTTNMYGDILSDLTAEISGSLGLGASLNLGDHYAVAQAQHGSAPDIAGKNRANPTSIISSVNMLLRWLAQKQDNASLLKAASIIDKGLQKNLSSPNTRTADLGGILDTQSFTHAILKDVRSLTTSP